MYLAIPSFSRYRDLKVENLLLDSQQNIKMIGETSQSLQIGQFMRTPFIDLPIHYVIAARRLMHTVDPNNNVHESHQSYLLSTFRSYRLRSQ